MAFRSIALIQVTVLTYPGDENGCSKKLGTKNFRALDIVDSNECHEGNIFTCRPGTGRHAPNLRSHMSESTGGPTSAVKTPTRTTESSDSLHDEERLTTGVPLMPSDIDRVDQEILRILEDDSRLPIEPLATRAGVSQEECQARMERLQQTGHIGGFTIVRNYPDAATRPISALVWIIPDPGRNGQDLLRSMESIPEIITAEALGRDQSVLVRVQVPDLERLERITDFFRNQIAVLSVEVSMTMPLLTHLPPRHPIGH